MEYNPETKEQIVNLKNGKQIYKTHNGFRSFVVEKDKTVRGKLVKGKVTQVSEEYYLKAKKTG